MSEPSYVIAEFDDADVDDNHDCEADPAEDLDEEVGDDAAAT